MLSKKEWVEKQWPSSMFFDPRIHKRVIKIGVSLLSFPDRSLPKRFSSSAEIKGCYRFLNRSDMDHQTLQAQHYENTLQEARQANGNVLFIQDGSELIFNNHEWTMGLGPTADSHGNGLMFHSCLAVKIENEQQEVIGLASQKAWVRTEEEKETSEAEIWQEMSEEIGSPPKKYKWIMVGDRASDIFAFVSKLSTTNWDCVLRTKHDREILVNGEIKRLKSYIRSLNSMASMQHSIRARPGVTAREITLQVSWQEAEMLPPKTEKDKKLVKGYYVRVWCQEEPNIEWILFTLAPVTSKERALEVVRVYTKRWIIEEYHKCLKTGCKIEEAQLRTANRLFVLFGILGVVATQLLKLRDVSRIKSEDPAENYVGDVAVDIIRKFFKLPTVVTVRNFWRKVARLGGFLERKSDGDPGWQTIWYGWQRLQDMLRGAELVMQMQGM
jgi:transposase-like protein/DDE family transposase/transposase Tn5 family protein